MDKHIVPIAGIILASGMSRRMGTPKQLLNYNGTSLLEHTIQKLLKLPFERIFSIVGYQSDEIINKIKINDRRFEWKHNLRYGEGQSAALKCAVECSKDYEGMMVFLADQPIIKEDTLQTVFDYAAQKLISGQERFVVQPEYKQKKGHPVFFSKTLFPAFELLKGDEGGKRIIREALKHYLVPVDDNGILLDIDTPEDYQRLLHKQNITGISKRVCTS